MYYGSAIIAHTAS